MILYWRGSVNLIDGGVNSMVNDVLELESDKIIARIRAELLK